MKAGFGGCFWDLRGGGGYLGTGIGGLGGEDVWRRGMFGGGVDGRVEKRLEDGSLAIMGILERERESGLGGEVVGGKMDAGFSVVGEWRGRVRKRMIVDKFQQ